MRYEKCECGKLVNKSTKHLHKCLKSPIKTKKLNHKASDYASMISHYQ